MQAEANPHPLSIVLFQKDLRESLYNAERIALMRGSPCMGIEHFFLDWTNNPLKALAGFGLREFGVDIESLSETIAMSYPLFHAEPETELLLSDRCQRAFNDASGAAGVSITRRPDTLDLWASMLRQGGTLETDILEQYHGISPEDVEANAPVIRMRRVNHQEGIEARGEVLKGRLPMTPGTSQSLEEMNKEIDEMRLGGDRQQGYLVKGALTGSCHYPLN
ncbi:hypothetical protein CMI48_04170 [Candidatus Pacearchaeota archaeon]|nr:hypothetical protein [Candidatus Pacearchaeota archaeon]